MPAFFRLALLFLPLPILGNNCFQDPGQASSGRESLLPREIGSPQARNMRDYRAPCDTMFVRPGDTATFYAGTLFHFTRPEFKNRHIVVQGYLQLLGDPSLPVSMAGSITDTGVVLMAGGEKWGGIKIMPEGQLEARYTLITEADTALDIQSKKVKIGRMYFQNCGIRLNEDRTFSTLEAARDSMVVWDGPYAKSGRTGEKSIWRKPSTYWWAGGVVGVLGLGGTAIWFHFKNGDDNQPNGEENPAYPGFPQGGGR